VTKGFDSFSRREKEIPLENSSEGKETAESAVFAQTVAHMLTRHTS